MYDFKIYYNKIYDLMYKNGRSINNMRIYEPFGYSYRTGIEFYHYIEPDLWFKMLKRVDGLNSSSLYSKESTYGYLNNIQKPIDLSWKEFVVILLNFVQEPQISEYIRQIKVFVEWFRKNENLKDILDEDELQLEVKGQTGSYRMIARSIIK